MKLHHKLIILAVVAATGILCVTLAESFKHNAESKRTKRAAEMEAALLQIQLTMAELHFEQGVKTAVNAAVELKRGNIKSSSEALQYIAGARAAYIQSILTNAGFRQAMSFHTNR